MITNIQTKFILELYEKYVEDLRTVRKHQKELYQEHFYSFTYRALQFVFKKRGFLLLKKLGSLLLKKRGLLLPSLDDIEAEITYLLIREFRPRNMVEISPGRGWSTSWILNALKDNNFGQLWSFDRISHSTKALPITLTKGRWHFIKGDIRENMGKLPKIIDYLFMDSCHSSEFAEWYIKNIFPFLQSNIPISVHDVFHSADASSFGMEGKVITNWLHKKGIKYFTASPAKQKKVYDEIISKKKELKINSLIHISTANPMIFFIFKK